VPLLDVCYTLRNVGGAKELHMTKVAILTVSDSCSRGERDDVSGRTIEEILSEGRFEVCARRIVPDDREAIARELTYFADQAGFDVVLTTGGTGLGPRDMTPEATASVCDRVVPGIGETIRAEGLAKTPYAILSRGTAGIRKNTLVINLPGNPKAVRESLELVVDILPHAVEMMLGGGH
jgi:molybdenum cofactor synthesis domain-containing protein